MIRKKTNHKCVLCNADIEGAGHNPLPLAEIGRACDSCNATKVVPARMKDQRLPRIDIISVRWFSGASTVGVVLTRNPNQGFKAFIGAALGVDPNMDAATIAAMGAKLPWEAAYGFFHGMMRRDTRENQKPWDPLYIKYDGETYPPLF